MLYTYRCDNCKLKIEVSMSITQHTKTIPCSCSKTMHQVIDCAPSIYIAPQHRAVDSTKE